MTTTYNVGFKPVNNKTCSAHYHQGCKAVGMFRGDRLEELLNKRVISQSELARRVGVSATTIWKLAKEPGAQGSKHLHKIARELDTTPEYLLGETDDPDPGAAREKSLSPAETDLDEVEIDSLDLAYGMGGTFVDIGEIEVSKAKFSREWLRKFTHSPPDLLFTTSGIGDSMMPTINDHDVVIVDRSVRLQDAMGDKIWAIVFGGFGMIKRLRPMPDGSVKILSDNQAVPPELATDNDLFIVGRVVASVRRH